MERVNSTKNSFRGLWALTVLAVFSALLASNHLYAGATMADPVAKPEVPGPGESYAESRFGRAPAKVDLGVGKSYASHAVDDMEAADDDSRSGSRAPAGLMPDRGSNKQPNVMRPASSDPVPEQAQIRKGVQEVALIAGDLGFFPKTIFVSRDVPVRMFVTGSSKNTLCIMMDSFQVRKQVRSQRIEEISFTPNMPGKYRFYCPVNGMEGTLIVKELASVASVE